MVKVPHYPRVICPVTQSTNPFTIWGDVRVVVGGDCPDVAVYAQHGITEGFRTKMEVLARQAYGFRNFSSYRLRVRMLCG